MSLDIRMIELISIGASVGANCQPCLQYHITKAKEHGVSEQEIQEATQVGRTVRKGAANKMDQFIASLDGEHSSTRRPISGCGCSC
jgi:AhpD family alkylhydroperoxidase